MGTPRELPPRCGRACGSALRCLFDGVEHNYDTVDRGQGAVGVLAEILVAWCVQQVEGEPSCAKLITAEETEMPRSMHIVSEIVTGSDAPSLRTQWLRHEADLL